MQIVQTSVKIEAMPRKSIEPKPKKTTEAAAKKSPVNVARVEELMKANDLDWRKLAKLAGLSYETLWSMKSGRRPNTSSETLQKVAKALGVTVNDILAADAVVVAPPAVNRLLDIAGKLSELRQEELLRIANTFEKMEAEENKRPIPPHVIQEVIEAVQQYGPHAETANLILALRAVLGNQAGRLMINLGDTGGDKPGEPPKSEG